MFSVVRKARCNGPTISAMHMTRVLKERSPLIGLWLAGLVAMLLGLGGCHNNPYPVGAERENTLAMPVASFRYSNARWPALP